MEKSRAFNSGQQRREIKLSVKISGHFGARIINCLLSVACPFSQSDAMYLWGRFKGENEADQSQEFIRRPIAAKATIRSHINPRGTCMDKAAMKQNFLLAAGFPAVSIISPMLHTHSFITDVLQS